MKSIMFIMSLSLVFAIGSCKNSKSLLGPIPGDQAISDLKTHAGPGLLDVKVSKNKKYTKDNKTKAKVILKAKKDGKETVKFKLIYKEKNGVWKMSSISKLVGDSWEKLEKK